MNERTQISVALRGTKSVPRIEYLDLILLEVLLSFL